MKIADAGRNLRDCEGHGPWAALGAVAAGVLVSLTAMLLAGPSGSRAADVPPPQARVLLLPLEYHGPQAESSMADEAWKRLSRRIEARGNTVLASTVPAPDTADRIRRLGAESRVDFVIYGSLSLLGQTVSLDLRVVDPDQAGDEPGVVFAEGRNRDMGRVLDEIEEQVAAALAAPFLVAEVTVRGNRRVDTDAILQAAGTKAGNPFDLKTISSDIAAIFRMDFFEDVEADVEETARGKAVTFLVREKPAIRNISFSGNSAIEEDKVREAIDLKPFTIIKEGLLRENAEKIEALYTSKGHVGTTVTPSVKQVSEQAADVTFEISEGEKVYIQAIDFQGNTAFPDKELEALMETSEKRPLWIPTLRNIMALFKGDSAVLKWDALERDLGRISAFYHNQGYVDAKVGRPAVEREGASLFITIPVEEGERYGVGRVDIEEDLFKNEDMLLDKMKISGQPVFNQETLRQDILALTDLYADEGYAYADVTPRIQKDPEGKVVNVTLVVNKGPKVTFERIEISGNTSTRDKVIRRELRVKELAPFSATGLRKSRDRLNRLGYFEDVSLTPTKGSAEDTMDLNVQVKERPTGTFSIGAGYSSVEKLILMGEISKRNFLGKGQTLSFKGIIGSETNRYTLSFLEPYFMDTLLSFGVDLYNWEREYDDYTKDSTGGMVNLGYPLTDDLRFFTGLRMDKTKLSDLSENVSQIILDSQDIEMTRALSAGLTYDTRNDFYNPTRGWYNSGTVEYAGGPLGGDSAFVKLEGAGSYYHPLWKQLTGHVKVGMGYVTESTGGRLPVYEKFFLGGIDSIRGFKYGRVSPVDPETDERIGGEYMAYTQMETIFPLVRDMGLNGVCFLDMGNVWDKDTGYDLADLRKSIGLGIRWLSPMGPLRIEWGFNIDTEPGDDSSNWEFRMGGTF